MRIAVISDTHNNLANITTALKVILDQKADLLLHCGDLTSPSAADLLRGVPVIHVLGNGDLDDLEILSRLRRLNPQNQSREFFTGTWEGIQIAALHSHQPGQLRRLITSGVYEIIFHGHTHTRRDEMVGGVRLINPGSLGGKLNDSRSFCLLDLPSGDLDWHQF